MKDSYSVFNRLQKSSLRSCRLLDVQTGRAEVFVRPLQPLWLGLVTPYVLLPLRYWPASEYVVTLPSSTE
jgi:hypothetical protein